MNELIQILMKNFNISEELAEKYSLIEAHPSLIVMLLQADPSLSPVEVDTILTKKLLTKKQIQDLIYFSKLYNIDIRKFIDANQVYSIIDFIKTLNEKNKFLIKYIFSLNINILENLKILLDLDMPEYFLSLILKKHIDYPALIFLRHVYSNKNKNITDDKIYQALDLIMNKDIINYILLYSYLRNIPDLDINFLYKNFQEVFGRITTYLIDIFFNTQKDLELFLQIYNRVKYIIPVNGVFSLFEIYKNKNKEFNPEEFIGAYKLIIDENDQMVNNFKEILRTILSEQSTPEDIEKIKKEYDEYDLNPILHLLSNNIYHLNFNKVYKRLKYYESENITIDLFDEYPGLFGLNIDLINKFQRSEKRDLYEYRILTIFRERAGEWVQKFGGSVHDAGQFFTFSPKESADVYFKLREFLFKYFKEKNSLYLTSIASHWKDLPFELKNRGDFDEILNYLIQKSHQNENDGFGKLAFLFNLEANKYDQARKIYEDSWNVDLPEWAQIEPVRKGKYTGYFLQRKDPRGLFIGNYTDCCQHIQGQAQLAAIHSQISPFGAVFVVEDNKNNILAQSWAWEAQGQVIFDNIEGNIVKSDNDERKFTIIEIYKEAANKMKEKTGIDIFIGYNNEHGMKEKDLLIFNKENKKSKIPSDYELVKEKYNLDHLYEPDSEFIRRLAELSNKMDRKSSDLSDKIENIMIKSAGYPQSLIKTYFKNLLSDAARFGENKALSPFKKYVNQQIDPELFSMALSRAKTVPEARDVLRGFYSNVDELSDYNVLRIWSDANVQHLSKYAPNYNIPLMMGTGVGASPYLTTAPSTLSNTLMAGGAAAVTAPMLFKKPRQVTPNTNQNNLSSLLAKAKTKEEAKNILVQIYPNINDSAVQQIWVHAKQMA